MSVPDNITALTATEITSLPYDITEDILDAPGATHPVWFTYTARAGEYAIGGLATAETGNDYRPQIFMYTGPASAPVHVDADPNPTHGQPAVFPLTPGTQYWFKVEDNGGSIYTSPLVLSFVEAPNESIPNGSILINDDAEGLRAAILSLTTGAVIAYRPLTNGENGVAHPSGYAALLNDDTSDPEAILIYNDQLTLVATAVLGANDSDSTITFDDNQFYYAHSDAGATFTVFSVAFDGTVTEVAGPIAGNLWSFAMSRDGSIVYYYTNSDKIRRWDVATNLALSDLATGPSTGVEFDMLVLSDDSVVFCWSMGGTSYDITRHSAAGVLLNTYHIVYALSPTDGVRMAIGADDPLSIVAWSSFAVFSTRTSEINHIRVSDGIILDDGPLTVPVFEGGLGTAPNRFGNSKSCPLLVLRSALVPAGDPHANAPTWVLKGLILGHQFLKGLKRGDHE